MKKRIQKQTQGGRHHNHPSLAYTKRKSTESDSSAAEDSLPRVDKETKQQQQQEKKSETDKDTLPPPPSLPSLQEEQEQPPQKRQALNEGPPPPQPLPKGDETQEEMKKRRAEYSLEVGISSDSSSPGSTYKRERTKRFSIKRKSVIGTIDLSSTSTSLTAAAATATTATTTANEAEQTTPKNGHKKKKDEKDARTNKKEKEKEKEKGKKRKQSNDNNVKKKHTKTAINTPFKMVHEVIKNSFRKKVVPSCSKAQRVLHVFKTSLDRFQSLLFYEVTSQPKITLSQQQQQSSSSSMTSPPLPPPPPSASPQLQQQHLRRCTMPNGEKIQLLQQGIEAYKKEIEQWESVVREYSLGDITDSVGSAASAIIGTNSQPQNDALKRSKGTQVLLLPPFRAKHESVMSSLTSQHTAATTAAAAAPLTEEQDREIKTLVLSVDNLFPKIDAIQKALGFAEQTLPELSVRLRDRAISAMLESLRPPSGVVGSGGGSLFSSSLIPSYSQI